MTAAKFALTPVHLQLLRSAVVLWDHSEGGAPFIGAYGKRADAMAADVADLLALDSRAQAQTIDQYIQEMGTALSIALSCGDIQEGRFTFPNPLAGISPPEAADALSEIYASDYGARSRETIDFTLEARHIRLLRHLYAGWMDYANVAGVNSKYPYGSRSYYQVDMAEALGLDTEVDDDLHNELEYLHQEMQPALQVFLRHAKVTTGTYQAAADYAPGWSRLGP